MRAVTILVLLTLTAALAGCAGGGSAAGQQVRVVHDYDPDMEYIARVEAVARRRGVDVQWVNPPRIKDR